MRIVVALGANVVAAPALAKFATEHELLLVHGDGPHLGTLSWADSLSDLVAQTQGVVGYRLQQSLVNAGVTTPVVALVTQTVVAAADPAFAKPTRFVGMAYAEARARALAAERGWTVRADGQAWRRVVASPLPLRIVEMDIARQLVRSGTTVIIGGGGGVPVVEGPEGLHGVDAVVDKDHVAALVAEAVRADLLVVLTDVAGVMTDFGTPLQQTVRNVTADNLLAMRFPADSMGSKVAAVCSFVQRTGARAAIGSLACAADVITGSAGTHVNAP